MRELAADHGIVNPMVQGDYRYSLNFFSENWTPVGEAPVDDIDWEPAVESTHFEGGRSGRLPEVMNVCPAGIAPVWDRELGQPYVKFLQVVMRMPRNETFVGEIPTTYFADLARAHSATLVERGKLRSGEFFRYRVCAFETSN